MKVALSLGRKASTDGKWKPKKPRGRPKKQLHPKALAEQKKNMAAAVGDVYAMVHKNTREIGGNGSGGPIYGELTQGCMQKIIDAMVKWTKLGEGSRFIDVGCGQGKPSLHVAQVRGGVEFSFGLEYEELRTNIGLVNLETVLEAAETDENIGHNCILKHGDVTEAMSFDPFTHVYQYDVG